MPEPADRSNVVVAGIKAGRPHLGNYLGMIRPALDLTLDHTSFLFVADGHPADAGQPPEVTTTRVRETAAALLACGLDSRRCSLYRRSDVPPVFALAWSIECATPNSLLPPVADSSSASIGTAVYPVMIAADIVAVRGTTVPVGPDQERDLDLVRSIISELNHTHDLDLPIPEPYLPVGASILPGTDGRKMSKSLANTVPFLGTIDELATAVRDMSIVRPRDLPGEPERRLQSLAFALVGPRAAESFEGWSSDEFVEFIIASVAVQFGDLRGRYLDLMASPDKVDTVLAEGAERASLVAEQVVEQVRSAPRRRPGQPIRPAQ